MQLTKARPNTFFRSVTNYCAAVSYQRFWYASSFSAKTIKEFRNGHSPMSVRCCGQFNRPRPVPRIPQDRSTGVVNTMNLGYLQMHGPVHRSSHSDRLPAGRSGVRVLADGEIFYTRPNRPWGPPTLLYNGLRVSFAGVKRPRGGVEPTLSSADVKERVEKQLYSPFGHLWPVVGWSLPLSLPPFGMFLFQLYKLYPLKKTII